MCIQERVRGKTAMELWLFKVVRVELDASGNSRYFSEYQPGQRGYIKAGMGLGDDVEYIPGRSMHDVKGRGYYAFLSRETALKVLHQKGAGLYAVLELVVPPGSYIATGDAQDGPKNGAARAKQVTVGRLIAESGPVVRARRIQQLRNESIVLWRHGDEVRRGQGQADKYEKALADYLKAWHDLSKRTFTIHEVN